MSQIDALIARCKKTRTADVHELFEHDKVKILNFVLSALKRELVNEADRYHLLRELKAKRLWAGKDFGEDIARTVACVASDDPDENARSAAASCLAHYIDIECALSSLESIAADPKEIDFVREAAVGGIEGGYFEAERRKNRRVMKACVAALERLESISEITDAVAIALDLIRNPDD